MLSQKIQGAVGRELTVRPLRKDALLAPYMTPMKDIALFPNYEEGWGAQHKTEIVARWNKHLENFKQECRGKGDCRESRTILRNMRDALPVSFSVIYHKTHF